MPVILLSATPAAICPAARVPCILLSMAYSVNFDETRLGDFEFRTEAYRLIQEGLVNLLASIEEWNKRATQHGAKSEPYRQDADIVKNMIEFGRHKLSEGRRSYVYINGLSVGSMRYLRAGLELIIRRRRTEIAGHRAAGWPGGALKTIEESVAELERLAGTLRAEPADILWEILPQEESVVVAQQIRSENENELWDAFISHATEDKERFVRPLAEALSKAGLRVWYDEFALRIGDSLRRSIDKGLSRSRYGIVVLSPSFFAKEWPQRELDGLVAREIGGEKVILPIWHEIDVAVVREQSPTLADRVAVNSREGLDNIVAKLLDVLKPQA